MRLAGQLLAVSAVTLLLPWAGCQYAREVESALRDGEEQGLISTARLLGAALAPAVGEFAAEPERWSPGRGRGLDLYLHALEVTPVLDGFVEDWGEVAIRLERLGAMEVLAARRGAFVHLFVLAPGSRAPAALRVTGRAMALEFPLEAPGAVTAYSEAGPADPRARGYWQATSRGWQIEARVPATLLDGRLGLSILESDGARRASSFDVSPGWITGPALGAQAALSALAPPGQRAYVTDRMGFVLASVGPDRDLQPEAPTDRLDALYRRLLGTRLEADAPPAARPGQLAGRHIELAAMGLSDARRYTLPGGGLLAAAAPVGAGRMPDALVVVERDTDEILSLTSAATRRLLLASLSASLGAALVLLGYAALLSLRIRRLSASALAAVDRRGEVAGRLPGTRAGDEVGDLARSFDGLLRRVRDHNLYLQGLGGRLAHELRTPLAMVRTSLDNLEAESPAGGPWLGRARAGVERMGGLVNALSAAQRIERAVASAERQRFDLALQLEEMTEGYRALHPGRPFELKRPGGACWLEGSADLIAQLLDKLVENAVDFAPPGVPVQIMLEDRGEVWHLAVRNGGSHLPPGPTERLFDSLFSARTGGGTPHLGLGLFIVRLAAEVHHGHATARNLPDGQGVEFAVTLPGQAPGR